MKPFLILTTAIASLGVLSDVPTETLAPVSGTVAKVDDTTGTIVGKVVFDGERPEPKPALTIKEKESEGCLHGGDGMDTEDRTLLIAEDPAHRSVVEYMIRTTNNLGVTMNRLYAETSDPAKYSEGLVYLSESAELAENYRRDAATLTRSDVINLAYLNTREVLYPRDEYELQIYNDIPEDLDDA